MKVANYSDNPPLTKVDLARRQRRRDPAVNGVLPTIHDMLYAFKAHVSRQPIPDPVHIQFVQT